MLGTPRALPAARIVPDARIGRAQLLRAVVRSAARSAWRRVQPQALVLALTGVGVVAVWGLAYVIAATTFEPLTAPHRPLVLYVTPIAGPGDVAVDELPPLETAAPPRAAP